MATIYFKPADKYQKGKRLIFYSLGKSNFRCYNIFIKGRFQNHNFLM